MKIAIVASSGVPYAVGGAEKLWWGMLDAFVLHYTFVIPAPLFVITRYARPSGRPYGRSVRCRFRPAQAGISTFDTYGCRIKVRHDKLA